MVQESPRDLKEFFSSSEERSLLYFDVLYHSSFDLDSLEVKDIKFKDALRRLAEGGDIESLARTKGKEKGIQRFNTTVTR